MVGGDHEDGSLLVIDLEEESPFTNAIAPSGGLPVLKALDVWTEIGVLAQDGVDVVAELGFDALLKGGAETREVLRELAGLKILNGGDEPTFALSGISGTSLESLHEFGPRGNLRHFGVVDEAALQDVLQRRALYQIGQRPPLGLGSPDKSLVGLVVQPHGQSLWHSRAPSNIFIMNINERRPGVNQKLTQRAAP